MSIGFILGACRKEPVASATPSPVPARRATPDEQAPATAVSAKEVPVAPDQPVVEITVTDKGYEPSAVTIDKGRPTHFKVKRVYDKTCADSIVIPAANVNRPLPVGQTVEFALVTDSNIPFGCPMGMMISGQIRVR